MISNDIMISILVTWPILGRWRHCCHCSRLWWWSPSHSQSVRLSEAWAPPWRPPRSPWWTDGCCWCWRSCLGLLPSGKDSVYLSNKSMNYRVTIYKFPHCYVYLYHWPMREQYQYYTGLSLANNQNKQYRGGTGKIVISPQTLPDITFKVWPELTALLSEGGGGI